MYTGGREDEQFYIVANQIVAILFTSKMELIFVAIVGQELVSAVHLYFDLNMKLPKIG